MPSTLRRWLPVVLWVIVIYTTIPFVRVIQGWFVARWDPILIGWGVGAALIMAAAVALVLLWRASDLFSLTTAIWISAITIVLVSWTFSLRRSPEEAVHLLEYLVLAVLIHRAMRPTVPDVLVFVAGALLGSLVGTVDEIIQWITPNRFWDWRDLVLNGGAGALVQLALWRMAPKPEARISPRSLQLVLRLTATQLALLTLCLANTPQRVAWYAPSLPGLQHLTSSINPMAEYGHRHEIPRLGVFKSRLTLAELSREDRTRDADVAVIMDESRRAYGRFLDTWPVAEDPFAYESRVHLFSRNRNLGKARKLEFEGPTAQEHLSVAWSENLLLEQFFTNTLEKSSFGWKPRLRQQIDSGRDPAFRFTSAAGSHLITFASEHTLRLVLLAMVVMMVVADMRLVRYSRRQA